MYPRSVSRHKRPRGGDGPVKVMLSIGAEQLRQIDARAAAACMTRSAYVITMTLRDEVGLVSAIEMLRGELQRFSDNAALKNEGVALP